MNLLLLFGLQAILIGLRTGKLLYVGTRNKNCYICTSAANQKIAVREHTCYKNYSGAPTAMEQDMLVEAFINSEKLHGVRYLTYVGDGDSSVMARIQQQCPYGYRVKKVPCKNHAIRVYTSGLYSVASNTALKHSDLRKIIRKNVNGLVKAANCAIAKATKNSDNLSKLDNTRRLCNDLRNGPKHVFGEHSGCGDWCSRKEIIEPNFVSLLEQSGLWREISRKLDYLLTISENLRSDVNTNLAECFMTVNNKIQGAKRINRANRGSYAGRTSAAALSFNKGPTWSVHAWKNFFGRSPNVQLKNFSFQRQRNRTKQKAARKLQLEKNPDMRARKRKSTTVNCDINYGPDSAQPDLPQDIFDARKSDLLQELATAIDTKEKREALFQKTLGQFQNPFYIEAKRHRLTASKYGRVIRMQRKNTWKKLTTSILVPGDLSKVPAIQYGLINEEKARKIYSESFGVHVVESGLCTNPKYPYLAASPDGLVGQNCVLEIKCLISVGENKIFDFVADLQGLDQNGSPVVVNGRKKKCNPSFYSFCLEIVSATKQLRLKRNCDYFFQVMGQMAITGRGFCDFFVYTEKDTFIERIAFDDTIWSKEMLPRLEWFYHECLLPELVDSRIQKKQNLREPTTAIPERNKKKKPVKSTWVVTEK